MTATKRTHSKLQLARWLVPGVMVGLVTLFSFPADAQQQYLTPNGTDPSSNTIPVAPPIDSSSSIQQKAGSLIIGPNGGNAKICLNASAADLAAYPASTKCIQSWADVANSIGGPFLKYDPTNTPTSNATKVNPDTYPAGPGFVRIQARCVGDNCIDGNRQLYSFLTNAPSPAATSTRGLYATDNDDAAGYAAYFSGRLHIHQTIGGGDPLGQLCLNGFGGATCIDEWTDITPPTSLFLRLQSANPPVPDVGSISISGTGLLGSVAIDDPLAATPTASTCGDGICRAQTVTDPTNYETATNCPIDCSTIAQVAGLTIPNIGGQYCALSYATACTVSPDTCGANGPCVTMTGEIRVSSPAGQAPAGSQVQVIVVRAKDAPPTFVPLQGSTYTARTVFGNSTILFAGPMNQSLVNSLIGRDQVSSPGTYYYRAYAGNLYPRYGMVYTPIAGDATITYNQLTVTANPVAGGVPTSASPGSQIKCGAAPNNFCTGFYRTGTIVTIAPTPNVGYALSSWSGCTSAAGGVCSVTLNTDTSVTAAYVTAGASYTLTLNKFGTSRASVSSTPSGINCGLNCTSDTGSFNNGTNITITANPENNDDSVSWAGCNTVDLDTCNVTLTGDRTVNLTVDLAGGGGPAPCFAPGTSVNTPQGYIAIDNLKVGDRVMAFDEATGQTVVSSVKHIFVRESPYGRVTFSNGTTLKVTPEHRFFDPRSRTWRPISSMRPGDVVLFGYGATAKPLTLLAAEFTSGNGQVFNLEVERYHTYYVNGIVVHNRYQ